MRPRDLRFSVVGREKHWTGRRKKILGEGKYLVVGRGIYSGGEEKRRRKRRKIFGERKHIFWQGKGKKRRKKRKIKENIFLQRRRSTKRENEESI